MYNGIININKDKDFTSHDVIAKLRGIFKQKRIGHAGTLDPMATGVLTVLLGKATALSDIVMEKDKTYIAEVELGIETDTYDITGEILERKEVKVSDEELLEVINSFKGEQEQLPPMYSAIKVKGQKLYDLARKGKTVERKARKITVYDIKLLNRDNNVFTLEISCSKGTYIRSIAHDIGEKLGTGATLTDLTRTVSGDFTLKDTVTLKELEELKNSDNFENEVLKYIMPVDRTLSQYPALTVSGFLEKLVNNGGFIKKEFIDDKDILGNEKIRIYSENKEILALYKYNEKKEAFVPDIMLKE